MKHGSIIRVLVADDSALMRNLISRLLGRAPDILVAATARDGEDAVQKAIQLKPDVVTMDINMPKLDGISAMQMILAEKICPVIMLSSLTQQGAVETFECLELGAFDFVAKPEGTVSAKLDTIAEELITKVRAAAASGGPRRPRPKPAASPPPRPIPRPTVRPATLPLSEMRAIAIGISTGGPATISTFLPGLPADLPAAIFLVQHMPPAFISTYVSRLRKECAIEVVEAETGDCENAAQVAMMATEQIVKRANETCHKNLLNAVGPLSYLHHQAVSRPNARARDSRNLLSTECRFQERSDEWRRNGIGELSV